MFHDFFDKMRFLPTISVFVKKLVENIAFVHVKYGTSIFRMFLRRVVATTPSRWWNRLAL